MYYICWECNFEINFSQGSSQKDFYFGHNCLACKLHLPLLVLSLDVFIGLVMGANGNKPKIKHGVYKMAFNKNKNLIIIVTKHIQLNYKFIYRNLTMNETQRSF